MRFDVLAICERSPMEVYDILCVATPKRSASPMGVYVTSAAGSAVAGLGTDVMKNNFR
jgi:hypothetical protein